MITGDTSSLYFAKIQPLRFCFFGLWLHQVLATVESSFLFADTAPAAASAPDVSFR